MSKKIKVLFSIFLCVAMIFCSTVPAFAAKDNNSKNNQNNSKNNNKYKYSTVNIKCFDDVDENHWAYKYIMWMLDRDIVHGIGNNKFNPNGTVTRAEFAKMMVRTLDLKLISPDQPTFDDVNKKAWEYQYVESSKNYLTYYKTSNGNYFKPSEPSVREDMAVALVKALGYQNEAVDESIINQFADADEITPSLRKYVALAVKYGLMKGAPKDGKLYFSPMSNLTRAEASALLYRAFVVKEEKVPYEEDKLPYEDDENEEDIYVKPVVKVKTSDGKIVVSWNKIDSPKFQGYRVVISKKDSTPAYPENGYLYYITDKNKTSVVIDNSKPYEVNSDFGNYLDKGVQYYVSVTAEYSDKVVAGNAVKFKYDGPENPELYVAPEVNAFFENGKLVLRWQQIDSSKFVGYRVVASKDDSTPSYPENGYLYSITDKTKNYAIIDNKTKYTEGDFGGYFINGEKYYFSVTAVYTDKVVPGNAVRVKYSGEDSPELFPAPEVSAAYKDGKLVIKWDKIDSPQLVEYRLVISEENKTPAYPADGYYNKPYSADTTSVVIDGSKTYYDGDFSTLTYGNEYYFSVTAVYKNNKYVAGNPVKVLYLISDEKN